MNSCNYCDNQGAITESGVYVCDNSICRCRHIIHPGNNAVCRMFHDNALGVEFLLKITFATTYSHRRDLIFNPFPWFFKNQTNNYSQFAIDPLGQAATNRDYKAITTLIESMKFEQLMNVISSAQNDTDLQSTLGVQMYQLIKWIIETANIKMEFSEFVISNTVLNNKETKITRSVYHQFKILHDQSIESSFMTDQYCHLMHGSNIENWHSIIRNGIYNASNTKLMTAGAAYGPGVYLSDNLQINSGYSTGTLKTTPVDHNDNNHKKQVRRSLSAQMVVAVFQVAAAKDNYKKAQHIFVVPDSSQLLLRYLIVVPRGGDLATLSIELEKRFDRARDQELVMAARINTRQLSRLTREYEILSKLPQYVGHFIEDSNDSKNSKDTTYSVTLKVDCSHHVSKNLNIVIQYPENYPFEPPIMWVRSPIVSCDEILPSGVILSPVLLRSGWQMLYTTCKVIEILLSSKIEFVFDGNYDDNIARNAAIVIRK